jgi:hypothetical protein
MRLPPSAARACNPVHCVARAPPRPNPHRRCSFFYGHYTDQTAPAAGRAGRADRAAGAPPRQSRGPATPSKPIAPAPPNPLHYDGASCFLSRISGWRDRSLYPLAWQAAEFTADGALDHARALGHGAADSCLLLWVVAGAAGVRSTAGSYRAIVTEGRAIDPR